MPLIEWRNRFKTGNEDLDFEHRKLLDMINDLYDKECAHASKDTISDCFGCLYGRISAHFALEETLMKRKGFALYEAHKQDHEQLLEDIRDMMERYESGAYENHEAEMAAHLKNWFSRHFQGPDARLETLAR